MLLIYSFGKGIRPKFLYSILLIVLATACLDRFYYDIEKSVNHSISIAGFISDQPGPYEVRIYTLFDIESKESIRTPVSVKSLEILDSQGTIETLNEVNPGVYQTHPNGIRGVMGGVYKLRVELNDGKIYESLPDTILPAGSVDSLYFKFQETYSKVGKKDYNFSVFFDASYNAEISDQFIWKMTATFQSDTQPQNYSPDQECFYLEEIGICNFLPPCSGYVNIGTVRIPRFEKKYPCTCCQCWYTIYNDYIILSDDHFFNRGQLREIKAQTVPLNQWTLQYKIHVALMQMSLTSNSFKFWKAIREQKDAINDLFQPVTGIIPKNFNQINGTEMSIDGLFYATAISSKTQDVRQFDLPLEIKYPISLEEPLFADDCRKLFPNSSNLKPIFWTN